MKVSRNGARTREHDPLELVRDDISAIKRDLTALASSRIDAVAERTRNSLSNAGEGVKRISEFSREQAELAHKRIAATAGEHPLKTIAVAAVGGAVGAMILGRMWRRSDE